MESRRRVGGLRSLPKKQIIITMAGVMLAMFLSSLDQTIVGVAMPRIVSDLGGFAHYTWVTTSYIITSAVVMPITGKLTDMYGRKAFYIAGIAIFIIGSLLCGFSNSMIQIILYRGLQGIGAGVMMANAFTVIGDLFPPAQRGKYQGFMSGIFAISSIIGPILGGYLTDAVSWHWVFFVNIPLGIVIIILFILYFPNMRPDSLKHKIDTAGLVTLVLAVVPAMLAFSWAGSEYAWDSLFIVSMLAFSAVMLGLFIFIEKRAAEPIIPLWLFTNRVVAVSYAVVFLTAFGMFGGIVFIPLYFQAVKGATAASSGSYMTPMMLGLVAGSFVSGQLMSRLGGKYRILGGIGIAIMAVGLYLTAIMGYETTYNVAIMNIVIMGIGLGVTMPLYTIAVQNAVPYRILGVATSSTAFIRSIGASVGLAIFGSVMSGRFISHFIGGIPEHMKGVVPMDLLGTIAHNPQALMSAEASAQLLSAFENLGAQGADMYQQVLELLRRSLESALSQVFMLAFFITLAALVVNFFIKEIPLKKEHIIEITQDNSGSENEGNKD
ncbi:MDR family MFS transporter [Chloroflexota bacterium]